MEASSIHDKTCKAIVRSNVLSWVGGSLRLGKFHQFEAMDAVASLAAVSTSRPKRAASFDQVSTPHRTTYFDACCFFQILARLCVEVP